MKETNEIIILGCGTLIDRWRTAAAEIGIGDFSVGFNVYTNKVDQEKLTDRESKTYGANIKIPLNKDRAYQEGKRLISPLYIGYKYNGFTYRVGYDDPIVQDIFQNGWHRFIGYPYFPTDYETKGKTYYYFGIYNPYTLY